MTIDLDAVVMRIGFLPPVATFVTTSPAMRGLTGRFVSSDEAQALDTVARLRAQSIYASMHVRDEPVRSVAQAERQVAAYVTLVADLRRRGLNEGTEVSVKLEQLGLYTPGGRDLSVANLEKIAATARDAGVLTTLDMEGPAEVDVTLEAARTVRGTVPDLGVAVQAYLPRTEADCRELAAEGQRVRLCKGGYSTTRGTTFTRRREICLSFVRCLRVLLSGDGYPMVATHDHRLIGIAVSLAQAYGRADEGYEFQMLQGIRTDLQRRLTEEHHTVRVYTAFGAQWYAWFLGRMAEKPSNARLLTRAVLARPA